MSKIIELNGKRYSAEPYNGVCSLEHPTYQNPFSDSVVGTPSRFACYLKSKPHLDCLLFGDFSFNVQSFDGAMDVIPFLDFGTFEYTSTLKQNEKYTYAGLLCRYIILDLHLNNVNINTIGLTVYFNGLVLTELLD